MLAYSYINSDVANTIHKGTRVRCGGVKRYVKGGQTVAPVSHATWDNFAVSNELTKSLAGIKGHKRASDGIHNGSFQ